MKKFQPDFTEINSDKLRVFAQSFLDGTLTVSEVE